MTTAEQATEPEGAGAAGRAPPGGPAGAAWDARPAAHVVGSASLALVAVAAAAGGLLPGMATAAGPAVLVVAGLLGLPHGAVDHLALGWARGVSGYRPLVLAAYALAAVAAATAALAAPLPALLVLLALSAWHFAEGEAAFDRLRGGRGLALPALALGVAVVVLPIELRPAQARPLLAALDQGLPSVLIGMRLALLLVTALLVTAGLAVALLAGQTRTAVELAVVVTAALLAPPLLAFSAWFAGWHAPRHLVRLAAIEPDGDGRLRLRRLAVGAAAPTAVAAAGLAGLALVLGGLPGALLVVLLALTVPHAAVVARLDGLVRQR